MQALSILYAEEKCSYIIFGREVGDNGTRHLQGYVEFPQRLRLTQVKSILGDRAHLERRLGTAQQAADYCRKDGDFDEYGEITVSQQGKRVDLENLKEDLKSGKRMRDICDEHFGSFLKYQKGINAAKLVYSEKRNWKMSVIVYHGRTGSGKTRAVFDNLPDQESIYVHPGGAWFDGYEGQPIVLFDDYAGSEFKLQYLLKLLDRYPMQVPVKGGFVSFSPKEIYITSNLNPSDWYRNAHVEHVNAMFRRFTNVVYFE